jgi:ABC-type transport system involved in multi-copper enzyme maturation permease subunit
MTRSFRAELQKLRRRRIYVAAAIGALAFALITTVAVVLSAEPARGGGGAPPGRGAPTLESLGAAGGLAESFSTGVSFLGILVLVLFVANFGGEFSQGTFRTLLMRQPHRIGLLAGKMAALLLFAGVLLALAELLSVATSLALAPGQEISTSSWLTLDGAGEAASAYASALLGVTAWATLGATLAVLLRSVPLALAVGVAWSGPIEHLVSDVWTGAAQWFPGLLLESWAVGGTDDVSAAHAALVLSLYVGAAAAVAALTFRRRDLAG